MRECCPYREALFQGRLWTPRILLPSLWLDAFDLSTITTTGSGVSEWRDKSGNARHFSQSSDSARPTITRVNGLPAILFDGVNDALQRSVESWMYVYPLSFIIAYRANAFTNLYNGLSGFYSASDGSTAGWGAFIKSNGKSALYGTSTTGQSNYDGNGALTYATAKTAIFQGDFADNIINSYGNGAADGQTTGTWTLRTNLGTGSVAIGSDPRFSRFTNWAICEALILPKLSTKNRNNLTGYLAWKWGSVQNIIASHPFRNRPPLIGD